MIFRGKLCFRSLAKRGFSTADFVFSQEDLDCTRRKSLFPRQTFNLPGRIFICQGDSKTFLGQVVYFPGELSTFPWLFLRCFRDEILFFDGDF